MAIFTPVRDLYIKDNEFHIAYGNWDDEDGYHGLAMRWINSTAGFPRSEKGFPQWFKIPTWLNVPILKILLDFPAIASTDEVLESIKELLGEK